MKSAFQFIGVVLGTLALLTLWLGPPIAVIYIIVHFVLKFW